MKIGTHPDQDLDRVRPPVRRSDRRPNSSSMPTGRTAANKPWPLPKLSREFGVRWFEEPVSADDLAGLHLLRDRAPAGMDIAAGEYGYDLWYFRRMLEAEAVDVLQADATRCAGITGFLQVGALCQARSLQLSAHCAPSLHVHPACALIPFRHLEYFHDHVRIEHMLFDGALTPAQGVLRPDRSRPGLGLEFKRMPECRGL